MKRFAQLYAELDATTSTNDKLAALQRYFDDAAATQPQDAAWALYFLAGGKPRQVVKTGLLKLWAQEAAGVPEWLFEESYQAVGDLAETIAHIVPSSLPTVSELGLSDWVARLQQLKTLDEEAQGRRVKAWWSEMGALQRFLLVKLIGGGFRVGVSKLLVTRALAAHAKLDAKIMAQRLMAYTEGKHIDTVQLTSKFVACCAHPMPGSSQFSSDSGQPYPFFLAHAWQQAVAQMREQLGPVSDWQAEWKYDGIRAQIVKRSAQVHLWSRGEELLNGRFPEIESLAAGLPDGTVLDGEILVMKGGAPEPFHLLQQRIGRTTLTKKILADAPVRFMTYDVLEIHGQDIRHQPQSARREQLEDLLQADSPWLVSPLVQATDWSALAQMRTQSRQRGVEGLMLKKKDAAYGQGRKKSNQGADGLWWKWKIDPLTVDGVLIYAQAGHGRRASIYTDYTFAVWNRTPRDAQEAQAVIESIEKRLPAQPEALQLVAFAKAYSGLTDDEFKQIDAIIRKTTLEKFGPVRSVKPSLVFELGFEGINRSPRHKSGIALRFPRMLRIRLDKPLHEANTLQDLETLL
ncbi:MAG: ATP-dependent DNA ligase [Brachymonas sp.]